MNGIQGRTVAFMFVLSLGLSLSVSTLSWAQDVHLVKDIFPQSDGSPGSDPRDMALVGTVAYFSAATTLEGRELWKSDGTASGTVLIRDILPGEASSEPQSFCAFNGHAYFQANQGTCGAELWETDGTADGTVMVKDICPGSGSSAPSAMVATSAGVYFAAKDPEHGTEIWRTDGTQAGTVLVKDIWPGTGNSNPGNLMVLNETLFFTARASGNTVGLWKSDGTDSGTVLVRAFSITPPQSLVNANGTLYFVARDSTEQGFELWKSNGTAAGTVLVKDIYPGAGDGYPRDLINVNGMLYFSAVDASSGQELWKSDGAEAGTVLVKDVAPGQDSSLARGFVSVNGTVYFVASDGSAGLELWKSDGTAGGTTLVKDIWPGLGGAWEQWVQPQLASFNGTVFFAAKNNPDLGYELWKSDGTSGGTVLVRDIAPTGNESSNPSSFLNVNGHLIFTAADAGHGRELWTTNGTFAGTVMVKDILNAYKFCHVYALAGMNGHLYFTANDVTHGIELWSTDGSIAGTAIVKDIRPGADNSGVQWTTAIGNRLYFVAYEPGTGYELYTSDGTAANTGMLKDINPGAGDAFGTSINECPSFTAAGGHVYFAANDGVHGTELWKTDGTADGTAMVKDIYNEYDTSSLPINLTCMNDTLYFSANSHGSGFDLYRTDGSASGTVFFRHFDGGGDLLLVNDTIYFTGDGGFSVGAELYKTNGTRGGTVLIKDIAPYGSDAYPADYVEINGTIFFSAEDGQLPWNPETHGRELWKTDGTPEGTVLVKDILPGTAGSYPENLVKSGGKLLFTAAEADHGRELWTSDGTEEGTVMVKDISPGYPNSYPQYLTSIGNFGASFAVFAASDGLSGMELWWTDGTADGTQPLADIAPGPASSNPHSFVTVGTLVFFLADDGVHGEELWVFDASQMDEDGDGIPDVVEGADDPDEDLIPNYLDPDSDGDGLLDSEESTSDADGDGLPNFLDTDSDNDSLPDSWEHTYSLDPYDATGTNGADGDPDGDGYANAEEYGNGTSPISPDPHPISVTAPNGGESWHLDTVHAITWTASGVTGDVRLDLFKGRTFVRTINPSCPAAAGTWDWLIPSSETLGSDYRIKVVSLVNPSRNDLSNADFTITTTAAPAVTVEQAPGQADPAAALPIVFNVAFERTVWGFDASDVAMGGTATGVVFDVSPEPPAANYTITVTAVGEGGAVSPAIPAGVCQDWAGNPNSASTSADNVVTYNDNVRPDVTVDQADGQPDPTPDLPIRFAVKFTEPVTGFTAACVNMGGTATSPTFTVTPAGPATDYVITVTAVAFHGTLTPTIPGGVCHDLAGNPNNASTSTDNCVIYHDPFASWVDLDNGGADLQVYGAAGDLLTEGISVAVGDINGDGIDDLLLGADGADRPEGNEQGTGAAYVYFGAAALRGTRDNAGLLGQPPDMVIYGTTRQGYMTAGGAIIAADLNGDHFDDIILGAYHANGANQTRWSSGEVYVIFGSANPPHVTDLLLGEADMTIAGPSQAVCLSGPVAADWNGDGVLDFAVSTPTMTAPGPMWSSNGAVYIFYGKPTLPHAVDLATDSADVTLYGRTGYELALSGKTIVGDINGDGIDDIFVGSRQGAGPGGTREGAGEVSVVFGSKNLPSVIYFNDVPPDVVVYGTHAYHPLTTGNSIALGDLNGDGYDDLVLGSQTGGPEGRPGAGEGYIIFGSSSMPAEVDLASYDGGVLIYGASTDDRLGLGNSMRVGDLNGDGMGDLIVGAPSGDGPDEARDNAGEVCIIYGKPTWPHLMDLATHPEDVIMYGPRQFAGLTDNGSITVGDFNKDGISDLVLFVRDEGYVIYGSATLPKVIDFFYSEQNVTIAGGLAPLGGIVGDFNHDGGEDLVICDCRGGAHLGSGAAFVLFGAATPIPAAIPPLSAVKKACHSVNPLPKAYGTSRAIVDYNSGDNNSVTTVALTRSNNGVDWPGHAKSGGDTAILTRVAAVTWQIESDRLNPGTPTLTFHYLDSEIIGMNESSLRVAGAPAPGGELELLPASLDVALNRVSISNSQNYSFFVLVGESVDSDHDGLPDDVEDNTGIYVDPAHTGTNPLDPDSDHDGLLDGQEVLDLDPVTPGIQNPFNPLDPDTSGDNSSIVPDGIPDGANDYDGDGMLNRDEFQWGTNPLDPLEWADVPAAGGLALLAMIALVSAMGCLVIHAGARFYGSRSPLSM